MIFIKKVSFLLCFALITSNVVSCSSIKFDSSVSDGKSSDEKKDDIVLTIATMGDLPSHVQAVIDEFNACDNGYQIVEKNYIEFYKGETTDGYSLEGFIPAEFALIQDIINKDDIDIVTSYSFNSSAKYEIMQNKGAFADLYQFMDNDPEVNFSTLNDHVLSLIENDGNLYTLPTFYGASTLIGETKYVGSKENQTVDDFIEHWENMPDSATINYSRTKEMTYSTVLRGNLESFVDYKNAQVHFDSPDFKKILEFCNQFEYNNGKKSQFEYDAVNFVWDRSIDSYLVPEGCYDDCTFIGYPSSDGEGAFLTPSDICFSISSKSSEEKQKAAWEFIRTFFTEEWLNENMMSYSDMGGEEYAHWWTAFNGFSLNEKFSRKISQDIIDGKYYLGKVYEKDKEYEYGLPTQEDYDRIFNYIDSIDKWEVNIDGSLWNIINDEVFRYFADEITLDECIGLIQNRASIWISEQS